MSKEKVKELDKRVQNNKDRNKQEKKSAFDCEMKGWPDLAHLENG